MDKELLLREAEQFARSVLEGDATGHDWWHVYRVCKLAETIAGSEGADPFVCRMAALLHDVADEKLCGDEAAGLQRIVLWMDGHGVDGDTAAHIAEIVETMSFKGGGRPPMRTLEGRVVQDADRLDAIGAVGIARTFAYAGAKGTLIHDPSVQPRNELTKEQYRSGEGTAISHFHEKLLKLKGLMNTAAARKLAEERHETLLAFLERFHAEWEGLK